MNLKKGFKHLPSTIIGLLLLIALIVGWFKGLADITSISNALTGITAFCVAFGLINYHPKTKVDDSRDQEV